MVKIIKTLHGKAHWGLGNRKMKLALAFPAITVLGERKWEPPLCFGTPFPFHQRMSVKRWILARRVKVLLESIFDLLLC